MSQEHYIDIFLDLDVGKTKHHACALDREGNKLFDKPLPQVESDLAKLFDALQQHGTVLVVIDQPNTIGALLIAFARDRGCQVGYLPGLAMRKAVDTARTMPHTLRAVDRNNEVLSALKMLSGFDDDIARDCTRTINRLCRVLTQIYPSLERVFTGSTLTRTPVIDLLIHYKGPQGQKRAEYHRVLMDGQTHPQRSNSAGRCNIRGPQSSNRHSFRKRCR
ncbi:IS110 family transposase [Corynebacterium diphtheriae]|nr:IS110 family transposase [Corynebacterium diphtheriae]